MSGTTDDPDRETSAGGPARESPPPGRGFDFGKAPSVLAVAGGFMGGALVYLGGLVDALSVLTEIPFGIVGGAVFGVGIGYLTGLIAAMVWVGE